MNRTEVVATESDHHRACVIVDAWRQTFESGKNLHPSAVESLRGIIAQALADERALRPREERKEGDARAHALLRRAIGVVSDVSRLQGEISAVLDAYAAPGATPLPPVVFGEVPETACAGGIWECKIGETGRLPKGSDAQMRRAACDAYRSLTGTEPVFIFSGWGGALTDAERRVVNRR